MGVLRERWVNGHLAAVEHNVAYSPIRERHIDCRAVLPIPNSSYLDVRSWSKCCALRSTAIRITFTRKQRRILFNTDCAYSILPHIVSPPERSRSGEHYPECKSVVIAISMTITIRLTNCTRYRSNLFDQWVCRL